MRITMTSLYRITLPLVVTGLLLSSVLVSSGVAPARLRHRREALQSVNILKTALSEKDGYIFTPRRLPMLTHIAVGECPCFNNVTPSEKIIERVKSAVQTCVRTTIKRTADFSTGMPCDELASFVRKEMKKVDLKHSNADALISSTENEDAETYKRPPRTAKIVKRQTLNAVQDVFDAEHKYHKRIDSEPDPEPELSAPEESESGTVLEQDPSLEQNPDLELESATNTRSSDGDSETIGTSDINSEELEDEDTPESVPEFKEKEIREFHVEIDLDDLEGVEQFSFIADILDDILRGNRDILGKGRMLSFPGPARQSVSGYTGLASKNVNPVKLFMMHAMLSKMQDYMQECIATELEFLDLEGNFSIDKYKKFFSMAFQDKNKKELEALNKVIDMCDEQTSDVITERAQVFITECMEPQIKLLCESKSLLDPLEVMSESIKKTSGEDKAAKKRTEKQKLVVSEGTSKEDIKETEDSKRASDAEVMVDDFTEGSASGPQEEIVEEPLLKKSARSILLDDVSVEDSSTVSTGRYDSEESAETTTFMPDLSKEVTKSDDFSYEVVSGSIEANDSSEVVLTEITAIKGNAKHLMDRITEKKVPQENLAHKVESIDDVEVLIPKRSELTGAGEGSISKLTELQGTTIKDALTDQSTVDSYNESTTYPNTYQDTTTIPYDQQL